MILSGFCPARVEGLSVVWCPAAETHLKLLERLVIGASFLSGGMFKYYACSTGSGVTRCTLFMVHTMVRCFDSTSAYLWASSLKKLDRRTARLLFTSQYLWGTVLVPCIRWCGTVRFWEPGQSFCALAISASCVTDRVCALTTLFNNNNNNNFISLRWAVLILSGAVTKSGTLDI